MLLSNPSTDKITVTISEPTTLATDYLLAVLTGVLASRVVAKNRTLNQVCVGRWAMALAAVAFVSLSGGTYHGFAHALNGWAVSILWKLTTIGMGLASLLLLASAFAASFSGAVRRWLIGAAAVKFVIYTAWMLLHDAFVFVIADYGSTLLIVLFLAASGRLQGAGRHRAYIAGGIAVSLAAAAIQQSGIDLHRHFNHNDLMHVVQMGGVWLLYEGGVRLRDAGEHHVHQP
jgi:Family of unknown function (DUF6962)